jgi:hypothetical protein
MSRDIQVVTRPVRQITIDTVRPWSEFRADYERAVPHFDRLEASGWCSAAAVGKRSSDCRGRRR